MIRWGIIGAGKIAQRFVKSLAHESNSELYAVSCRTLAKAQQFADTYHALKAYGSYEELLQDHMDGILFYDHINKKEPNKPIEGALVL